MAKLHVAILFGVLTCHSISAAPSEVKLEDIADVISADQPEETKPQTLVDDPESTQGQRQKRWYDYFGFDLPPVIYKRDDNQNTGVYGTENPFVQIHRRLQEISGFVRNPITVPPPIPVLPPFLPVIYIPQVGCGCNPSNKPNDRPAPPDNNNQSTEDPFVGPRWPEMEDERQNWGLLNNDTNTGNDDVNDNDGARPISFDPIKPIRPNKIPPPPVEHGSSQGDLDSLTTTYRPIVQSTQRPNLPSDVNLQPPSVCDRAILSCCDMKQDLYSCFVSRGCPDPSAYGNPCDYGVIQRVIDRFGKFYNRNV